MSNHPKSPPKTSYGLTLLLIIVGLINIGIFVRSSSIRPEVIEASSSVEETKTAVSQPTTPMQDPCQRGLLSDQIPCYSEASLHEGANFSTHCDTGQEVSQTFANGASWRLCWLWDYHQGIVLRQIFYKSPLGVERQVLKEAAPAELHVAYDNGSTYYLDVSKEGLGINNESLTAVDCPNGLLHLQQIDENDIRAVLCQTTHNHGYASKRLQDIRYGESLELFSVSKIDAYEYVYLWSFHDDGAIDIQVGATGQLNEYGLGAEGYGWDVDPPVEEGRPALALSHVHTFWYRLDFDIDGPQNDIVEEFNFISHDDGLRQRMEITQFETETARTVDPTAFRFWRIKDSQTTNADGHAISYRLEPTTQAIYRGIPEWDWTFNDLYITTYNPCERWLVNNEHDDCATKVTEYVNDEPLSENDIVLWYGTSFHHLPRDEDQEIMPIHWEGFHLVPHDWSATNESVLDQE